MICFIVSERNKMFILYFANILSWLFLVVGWKIFISNEDSIFPYLLGIQEKVP